MEHDPIEALAAEGRRLDELLRDLSADEWEAASSCAGWSVKDVVLHLAQTEEAVSATVGGGSFEAPAGISASNVDELMDAWVSAEREAGSEEVLARWRDAHSAAIQALRSADPDTHVQWAAAPLKPRTLATTRLAEHWIHALDISEPLGRELPDTDRLWHIARLAHRTLPYAFARAGRSDAPSCRFELSPPGGGAPWIFGEEDSSCRISGRAGELCRVAGRRLDPAQTSLKARGSEADDVLSLIRTYA